LHVPRAAAFARLPALPMTREVVRSVQGGAGTWSSAQWRDGAIVVVDGVGGLPPCAHRFRAFKDWRGLWTGKARCVYCGRGTSWKTKSANLKPTLRLLARRRRNGAGDAVRS